jgi:hypothetical protein
MNMDWLRTQEFLVPRIAGLEASISGGKIHQIWMHVSQPYIVYGEYARHHRGTFRASIRNTTVSLLWE